MIVGNLPNILTIIRILLLPFFTAAIIYNNYQYALLIFIIASITDIFDGILARLKKQTTEFGRILDPVADKFLLITSFILLSIYGLIPTWLTIIIISRDLIVVTGCLILYFVTHKLKVEPSIFGKIANALQFLLIGLTLLSINIERSFVPLSFLFTVAGLTTISGLHYIYKGLKIVETENI